MWSIRTSSIPQGGDSDRDELIRRLVRAQDLTLVDREDPEAAVGEILLRLRALSRITSQSWGSDLRQIWPRTIERNRKSSQVYAEDFAIEERLKMA